jgi:hypothetical protein
MKAIQTRSGKATEDSERSAGARKLKPSAEAEEVAKEKVTGIVTEDSERSAGAKKKRGYHNSSHATTEVNLITTLRSLWRSCVDLA